MVVSVAVASAVSSVVVSYSNLLYLILLYSVPHYYL